MISCCTSLLISPEVLYPVAEPGPGPQGSAPSLALLETKAPQQGGNADGNSPHPHSPSTSHDEPETNGSAEADSGPSSIPHQRRTGRVRNSPRGHGGGGACHPSQGSNQAATDQVFPRCVPNGQELQSTSSHCPWKNAEAEGGMERGITWGWEGERRGSRSKGNKSQR